ncbi:serine carboxypeptidase [Cylindrobasidium torrendii FP15055 ss-10]|uniref:Carboxypeptidase n=1 Tax=Cylindrobasidium torrendii FP15055 ss-10 TaxID=1314674 RepID=A0A0D7BKG1_9AGAR|nr:serine carboxypeptidase [Cylindrobasidium torrendii FP15055 ss-10]
MLWTRTCSFLGLAAGVCASHSQTVLGSSFSDNNTAKFPEAPANDGLFTPLESLAYVREDTFTTLGHPLFPNYSVRIKKSDFCDETVGAYTGYIDIEAHHIFFYFFESRSDPDKDDVIFWTNGGPGCSSSLGLLMELGPCRVVEPGEPKHHPESWNSNANVFFIDQPIGVGFSYADYGEYVGTTEDAAKDVAAFVSIFFENFSQFKGRAFHMAGESYGGRYLPVFAAAVYDNNAVLVKGGATPVNLTSVMIGNGITDPFTLILSYYDMVCTAASVPPVFDIETCVYMKKTLPRCQKWLKAACEDQFDTINCAAAASFCQSVFSESFFELTDLNPYDISKPCDGPISETLCYPQTKYIANYLSDPKTRALLGVDPAVPANFTSCSASVSSEFSITQDSLHPSKDYVGALLERGIRVLIYVGTYDWICNWVGNNRWTLELDWTYKAEYNDAELRDWTVDGKKAGITRSTNGLTFATIDAAGHMVPFDKPKESLELVSRWLAGKEL